MKKIFFILLLCFPCVDVFASCYDACFNIAGSKYHIDPKLLKAMSIHESSLKQRAVNKNRDKQGNVISIDYGCMQINSTHISELKNMHVIKDENDLLDDACLNIQIGAWILAKHLKRCGVNWMCLGTYNAGFNKDNDRKRMAYSKEIYDIYFSGHKRG